MTPTWRRTRVDVSACATAPSSADRRSRAAPLRSQGAPSLAPSVVTTVLVHGGGSTAWFWDRLVPRLSDRSLAVDLPGRAGKPVDLAGITVDDEVASVLEDV